VRCGWLWVGTDEQGLHANGGRFAAWDRIDSIDKSRWRNKGIAIVHYTDAEGTPRRITLDDWKYETENTRQILRQIETQLGEEHADDQPAGGSNGSAAEGATGGSETPSDTGSTAETTHSP
jgi:hypothetical protein